LRYKFCVSFYDRIFFSHRVQKNTNRCTACTIIITVLGQPIKKNVCVQKNITVNSSPTYHWYYTKSAKQKIFLCLFENVIYYSLIAFLRYTNKYSILTKFLSSEKKNQPYFCHHHHIFTRRIFSLIFEYYEKQTKKQAQAAKKAIVILNRIILQNVFPCSNTKTKQA